MALKQLNGPVDRKFGSGASDNVLVDDGMTGTSRQRTAQILWPLAILRASVMLQGFGDASVHDGLSSSQLRSREGCFELSSASPTDVKLVTSVLLYE